MDSPLDYDKVIAPDWIDMEDDGHDSRHIRMGAFKFQGVTGGHLRGQQRIQVRLEKYFGPGFCETTGRPVKSEIQEMRSDSDYRDGTAKGMTGIVQAYGSLTTWDNKIEAE